MTLRTDRLRIAQTRLQNILRRQLAASARTLEQKISDAGPTNQRVDPHILTEARNALMQRNIIGAFQQSGARWYYLTATNTETVTKRVTELDTLHRQTKNQQFTTLLGQTLEIATLRALQAQSHLEYFGNFSDLDAHDDSTAYRKEEPPSFLSGRQIPSGKKLDFLIRHPEAGYAGIEVKNIREWIYPDRDEIREMVFKCCSLDIVPILIARRIHYSTFSILNPCGVIIHQTFNHDVRVGNEPDARLSAFIHDNLPRLLPPARLRFDTFKDLLCGYGNGEHGYKSFAARVKRRIRGESEDVPEGELGDEHILEDF